MKKRLLDVRTILVMVICITSLSVYTRNIVFHALLTLFCGILAIVLSGSKLHTLHKLLHRFKRVIPLLLTIAVFQLAFRRQAPLLWEFGVIKISESGVHYAVNSMLRVITILLSAGLLFSIPSSDFLVALRGWKIPYELCFMIAMSVHFLPVFKAQVIKIKEAAEIRGIDLREIPFRLLPATVSTLFTPLVVSAIKKIKFQAISLDLKGFRIYPNRTSIAKTRLTGLDYTVQAGFIIFFALSLAIF